METNVNILNEISVKLGGESGASSVVEALNNIANALGDTDPDVIRTVNDSLNDILEYAGQGGGGGLNAKSIAITVKSVGIEKTLNPPFYILDETYGVKNIGQITVGDGESVLLGDALAVYYTDYDEYDVDINAINMFTSYENAVNCEYGTTYIAITDPTQPASITLLTGTEK